MRLKRMTPMLGVGDIRRTIAFYCDDLGFRCVRTFGSPEPRWCHLERDGVYLMFNRPEGSEAESAASTKDFQIFYFYPDDVVALHAALAAKGLAVTDLRVTIYGMKEFELRDPDGYWLWFGQDTNEPATVRE